MGKFIILNLVLTLLFLLFVQKINTNETTNTYSYQEMYLNVPLDHFSYANNHTFPLRYLINDTFADGNRSPILFYTGNEGSIELFAENTGFIWEAAQNKYIRGVIVFAEHRYYGKSLPFGNKSLDSPEHAGYLTAEQALADYAQLLDFLMDHAYNRPVIAIGGSYGGMLAAWFRMKYPQIVTGALAASAPILQFTGLTPCNVFGAIVSSVFRTALDNNHNCSLNIQNSWNLFRNYSTSESGRAILSKKFNFCNKLNKTEDIDGFFDYLDDVYGNLAMANYPYENSFLAPLPAYPVRQFCGRLSNLTTDVALIEAMNEAINIYSNYTGNTKCLDYTSAYAPSMGAKTWDFQACTEMVMPMCFEGPNNIFRPKKWDFKAYSNDCQKKFNVQPREHEMVIRYGGANIGFASNIIFSNGLSDPWSGGGVLRYINSHITIIVIPEGAHHIDLRATNPEDPASVRNARNQEIKIIQKWILDFYNNGR